MAYGPALKQRVVTLYDQGLRTKEIAEGLVCPDGARRVKQRRNDPPRKIGGGPFKLNPQACQTLKGWVDETPDATLEELRTRIADELKITIGVGALWNTLRQLKLSLRKVATGQRAKASGCQSPARVVLRAFEGRPAERHRRAR